MEITREKAMEVIKSNIEFYTSEENPLYVGFDNEDVEAYEFALADMKMLNEIYQIVFNNSLGNSAFDEIRRILINGEH